ncbi:enoyl-CoA hydratase-related protein [Alkalihalobacillus oceani]|uniref:Enoyl-CoA hydratase-related protein n=1 Tax=Halalkalibacter oceani TaxID=1653776 RepID=A0A9X2DMB4_9BACI|nr:enoyl-CoA hydratase-related protein [Halalkalibacter oceani]
MSALIAVENRGKGIVLITLRQPERANALSLALLVDLQRVLRETVEREPRVLLFRGEGENVFCAGADLKERVKMTEAEVRRTLSFIRATIEAVAAVKQPTIAAMNGHAFGGGLELGLACDLRVVGATSLYGLSETSLGIIPGAGGTQRLARLIGLGKAKELIYTAARISGKEAERIGLAEKAVPQEKVVEEALQLAGKIAEQGPIAVQQAKQAIDAGYDLDLQTALTIEQLAYERTLSTKDRLEGLRAFQEKRKPHYKGE